MNTPFAQKVVSILRDYCDEHFGGNVRAASRSVGIDPDTGYYSRWLKCLDGKTTSSRVPRIDSVGPCLDKIGAVLLAPGEVPTTDDNVASSQHLAELEAENASLREQLILAQGEIHALERQLARLMPAPGHLSEKTSPSSAKETRGSSVKAG